MKPKVAYADDHFHDECGVFGVFGHPEAANITYLGLYALQHRGQESAGIVSSTGNDLHIHRAMGEVEEIFSPPVLAKLPGSSAISRIATFSGPTWILAEPRMGPVVTPMSRRDAMSAMNYTLSLRKNHEKRNIPSPANTAPSSAVAPAQPRWKWARLRSHSCV